MKHVTCLVLICVLYFNFLVQTAAEMLEDDNGIIHVKLDLVRGGAIAYISESGSSRNLVNVYDEGRYIQQSYYAGNSLDRRSEGQNPIWSPWPWNPIQVGDSYRNRAQILDQEKNGDTLYVRCIPMQWDMNNKPAEAEMEQWTVLSDNMLIVRNRLTCMRSDTIYGENIFLDQELPAVYPISALKNLYSYTGSEPFSGALAEKIDVVNLSSGFWGIYPCITEHWMAFVDDDEWGMGVYNSHCTNFLAGMAGYSGGEATSSSTSYIAPIKKESLKKDSVYEYEYYIILGTVDDIRNRVYELDDGSPSEVSYQWEFNEDDNLEGWMPNESAAAVVSGGNLHIDVTAIDPYLTQQEVLCINAAKYNRLVISMKNNSDDQNCEFFFWNSLSDQHHLVRFSIIPNDRGFREYLVDLSENSSWDGMIHTIRIDPVSDVASGSVDIDYIRLEPDEVNGIINNNTIPEYISLSQNYPNPFNPTTMIDYRIPWSGLVKLSVYDLTGRKVQTLVDKFQTAGTHQISWQAEGISSGLYIYQLQIDDWKVTKKMLLQK